MRERITELVEAGTTGLVIDLHRTEFLDSTGLGVLMGGMRRMRFAGGSFGVVVTREALLRIFRITGIDQSIPLYPTVGAAVKGTPEAPKVDKPPPVKPTAPIRVRPRQHNPPAKAIVRPSPASERPIRPAERPQPPPPVVRRETRPVMDPARLTPAQKSELVDHYVKGMGIYDVAEMFSVSDHDVWKLLREQGLGPAEWP